MIYLFPAWQQEDYNMDYDDIFNIVRILNYSQKKVEIILTTYMLFPRYKIENLNLTYWSAYDKIQKIAIKTGIPLMIEDLSFPKDSEFLYTPIGITVLRNGKMYAEVSYNEYGCLSKITYYTPALSKIEYFDDRGFLSSVDEYEQEMKIKKSYYNERAEHTLTEYFFPLKQVIIEPLGAQEFSGKFYTSIDELLFEVLMEKINEEPKSNRKLLAMCAPSLVRTLGKVSCFEKITWLIQNDQPLQLLEEKEIIDVLGRCELILTDTEYMKQKVFHWALRFSSLFKVITQKVPFYDLEFEAGTSNFVQEMLLYVKIDNLTQFKETFSELLLNKVINEESYYIIFAVKNQECEQLLHSKTTQFIDSYFGINSSSPEFKKTLTYIQTKRQKKLLKQDEEAVEELRKTSLWQQLVAAINVYERIEYRQIVHLYQVKELFERTRLYIDMDEQMNLKMQLMALVAGIPQIVRNGFDFVFHKKNGIIYNETTELNQEVDHYLKKLSNWNQSLIQNIEILEKYDIENVSQEWRGVLDG